MYCHEASGFQIKAHLQTKITVKLMTFLFTVLLKVKQGIRSRKLKQYIQMPVDSKM